jgi:hypothetical protein
MSKLAKSGGISNSLYPAGSIGVMWAGLPLDVMPCGNRDTLEIEVDSEQQASRNEGNTSAIET